MVQSRKFKGRESLIGMFRLTCFRRSQLLIGEPPKCGLVFWPMSGDSIYCLNPSKAPRSCIQQYDETPSTAQSAHHRMTREWLDKGGPLRHHVEAVASGRGRGALPQEAQLRFALLRYASIVERCIEGVHRDVKKDVGLNRGGPCMVSAAIRSNAVLERGLSQDVHLITKILPCIHLARKVDRLPELLGVKDHPELLSVRGREQRGRHLREAPGLPP